MRFFKSVTAKSTENMVYVGSVSMTHDGKKYTISENKSGDNLIWTIKYKEHEVMVGQSDYATISDLIDDFSNVAHHLNMMCRDVKR